MKPLKLFFFLSEPTPYHNLLLEYIGKRGVSLHVYYLSGQQKHHPWEIKQEHSLILKTSYCRGLAKTIKNYYRDICTFKPNYVIVGGYYDLRIIAVFILNKFLKIRFAFWSDTPRLNIKRPVIKRTVRSAILKWIFKNAEIIFSTGNTGQKLIRC